MFRLFARIKLEQNLVCIATKAHFFFLEIRHKIMTILNEINDESFYRPHPLIVAILISWYHIMVNLIN